MILRKMKIITALYSVDFKGSKLYLSEIVGGTGVLIRRNMIIITIKELYQAG